MARGTRLKCQGNNELNYLGFAGSTLRRRHLMFSGWQAIPMFNNSILLLVDYVRN